jgi:predicted GNAT family acetyltransferase
VDYSQAAKSSIAGKTTKKELDEEDLATTKTNIKIKTEGMQTAVDLLDKALQELEELKPTCIDTGMSYAERVKKREEEIKALEKALEILAPPS